MTPIDEAFTRIVADFATDSGWQAHLLLIALAKLPAYADARQRHKDGGTEKVVRFLLGQALAQAGLVPQEID